MGSFTFMAAILSIMLMIYEAAEASNCPPPSKIYTRTPTCVQDHDCKDGKICCRNASNSRSCVERYAFNDQDRPSRNYHSNSPWKDCNGVKCMPYEVCKPDPHTGRLKCQLA